VCKRLVIPKDLQCPHVFAPIGFDVRLSGEFLAQGNTCAISTASCDS
jgi:hypothetical protein